MSKCIALVSSSIFVEVLYLWYILYITAPLDLDRRYIHGRSHMFHIWIETHIRGISHNHSSYITPIPWILLTHLNRYYIRDILPRQLYISPLLQHLFIEHL